MQDVTNQLAFRGFILCNMQYMEGHVSRGRRGNPLLDDLEDTQNISNLKRKR